MEAAAALLALSILGAANALYFVLVTYRWMRPDPRWLPPLCRMDEATCARVVDTPYARLFGVPNAVLGLLWYVLVGAAAVVWLTTGDLPLRGFLLLGAAFTVAVSIVLAASLIWGLRTPCVLCFSGHATNAAILVVLLL